MKTLITSWLMVMFFSASLWAQDTIPLYSAALAKQATSTTEGRTRLGIDLGRLIWVFGSQARSTPQARYVYPVSATLYLPEKNHQHFPGSTYINAGYAAYGGTIQRDIYQHGHSLHLRVGRELTKESIIMGYGVLLTGWSGQGSFVFKGPFFGDYEQSTGQLSGLAVGGEGHVGARIALSPRLALQLVGRLTLLLRTTNGLGLPPPYLSGLDTFNANNNLGVGGSGNLNLVFQL